MASDIGETLADTRRHQGKWSGAAGLIDRLQFLAGLEANCLAGRNVDLGTGAWIAANTGFARTYVEDAKTAQFNAVALGKSSLHTLEDGLHGALSLGLSDPCAVYHFVDDIEFDQAIGSDASD